MPSEEDKVTNIIRSGIRVVTISHRAAADDLRMLSRCSVINGNRAFQFSVDTALLVLEELTNAELLSN